MSGVPQKGASPTPLTGEKGDHEDKVESQDTVTGTDTGAVTGTDTGTDAGTDAGTVADTVADTATVADTVAASDRALLP
ncbi:MAG: hypothetical protein JRF54_14705 [Deltaproteobacteria bacterium]|nr:hypothetical protein [Deltaproteobacteria bacterium]